VIARHSSADLDRAFAALAHPVRRRILESTLRKGRGVTELTEEFRHLAPRRCRSTSRCWNAPALSRERSRGGTTSSGRAWRSSARPPMDRTSDDVLGAGDVSAQSRSRGRP